MIAEIKFFSTNIGIVAVHEHLTPSETRKINYYLNDIAPKTRPYIRAWLRMEDKSWKEYLLAYYDYCDVCHKMLPDSNELEKLLHETLQFYNCDESALSYCDGLAIRFQSGLSLNK